MKEVDLARKPYNDVDAKLVAVGDLKSHPCLHIADAPPDLLHMPEEGTATIKYKVSHKGHDKTRNGGNGGLQGRSSVTLDILSITPHGKQQKFKVQNNGAPKPQSEEIAKNFGDY